MSEKFLSGMKNPNNWFKTKLNFSETNSDSVVLEKKMLKDNAQCTTQHH